MNISVSTFLVPDGSTTRVGTWAAAIKAHLVSVGWTVAGSSDGVTGGMDAVDRPSDLLGPANTSDKWFVLQSPHASASDRVQILFSGGLAIGANQNGCVQYNPNADYADNGIALPTSAYGTVVTDTSFMQTTTAYRFHILADEDPPYGWAVQGHVSLNPATTKQGGMGLIPLSAQGPTNPGKPYVFFAPNAGGFFTSSDLGAVTVATTSSRCVAEPPNPPAIPQNSPALVIRNNGGVLMPNGVSVDTQNRDVSSPIIFQHADQFYGVSDFVRWTGTTRNFLDTFREGANPRARICFGEVTLPWDGTTVPTI